MEERGKEGNRSLGHIRSWAELSAVRTLSKHKLEMPSNWPSAIQQSSSSRASGTATELSEEMEFNTATVVREETRSLVTKVQTLQNAYEEYLDAEQVNG